MRPFCVFWSQSESYFYSSELLLAFLEAPSSCAFLWPSSGPGSLLARQRGPELWLLSVPLGPQFPLWEVGVAEILLVESPPEFRLLRGSGSRDPLLQRGKATGSVSCCPEGSGCDPSAGMALLCQPELPGTLSRGLPGEGGRGFGRRTLACCDHQPQASEPWLLPLVPQETSSGSGRRAEVAAGASGEMKCHRGQHRAERRAAWRPQDGLAYVCIWKYF